MPIDNNEPQEKKSAANNAQQSPVQKKRTKTDDAKPRGEFKVVFKGRLVDGFSKEQVVANIARLTKISEEKIQKKFFSGKAVIIRRAHDEPHAQRLQQLFINAGLQVIILRDTAQNSEHSDSKAASGTNKLQKKLKKNILKRKLFILAGILWGVLIALGINMCNEHTINVAVPEQIVAIEQSLANEKLVFLAHVNVESLLSLHHYFVTDPEALPGTRNTFFNKLKKSALDPEKTIKQILATGYLYDKTLTTHIILLGDFSVQSVKQFLIKQYRGEVIPGGDFVRIKLADIDPENCQRTNFKEVSIEPGRIVVSSNGHLDNLHHLLTKSPGNVTDLTAWENYRSDKLVSLALFKPEQGTQLTSGVTTLLIQDMLSKHQSLSSVYAGIGLQMLPPGSQVDIRINSRDQLWLNETYSGLSEQIEEMKTHSRGLVNLEILLNRISVYRSSQQEDGFVSVHLQLDDELKKSIDLSISELTDKFLTLDSSNSNASGYEAVAEKIDANPSEYQAQYSKLKLKPFNTELDNFFKPAWIGGPFAIAVEELLFEKDNIVLKIKGKGQNIANVGNKQAKLIINTVNDEHGLNLLALTRCGETADNEQFLDGWSGSKTAYINNQQVNYRELEASKKIKLKQGVEFSQVKSLEGVIELNLATGVKSVLFARTEHNKLLSEFDSRVLFKPSAVNQISYTISGDESRVLDIRALNKNQQYLSSSSSSSMNNLLGSGRSISKTYQGEIAYVEVVYAKTQETILYPYEITKFPPYPADDSWKYQQEPVTNSSLEKWNKNYQDNVALELSQNSEAENWYGKQQAGWHDGPFNLALYGLKTSKHWGSSGQLTIKTPVIDELRHNLSALEVYFRYPEATDSGKQGGSYFYQLKAKGYYMNGQFIPDKEKPYMVGQLAFNLPYKKEKAPLKEISGEIIVHLTLSQHSSSYTDMNIGAQWEDEGVRTKIVRLGNDVMEFEVTGNRSRLLQIILLDEQEQRISTSDHHYQLQPAAQEQKSTIIVNYHGNPVKAILTVSEGQQTRRYPFQLKLE